MRDRGRAAPLAHAGHELHEGDVLDAESLRGAGEGVDTAYYLVHSMGRGGDREGFAERERRAAENFAHMARDEGVERVVYLGGLGDERSEHLRAAPRPPRRWRSTGRRSTYFRAAMVVGAGSESYRTLRYLVERLPAMIAPAWLRNRRSRSRSRTCSSTSSRPRSGRRPTAARCRSAARTCSPTPSCWT